MKIYIKKDMSQNIMSQKLSALYKDVTTYDDIYSVEGRYRMQNNKLMKLIPQDKCLDYFSYNDIDFIIDKGSYIFRKDIYSIPYKHMIREIEQIEYKLENNSEISLIILYSKNKMVDFFFYTKKEMSIKLKDDIFEYISLFNDIKQS